MVNRLIKGHDIHDPYLSSYHGDFYNFPPVLIQTGTEEMCFDDSVALAQKCVDAGTTVSLEIYNGMHHAFPTYSPELATSKIAHQQVKQFIDNLI